MHKNEHPFTAPASRKALACFVEQLHWLLQRAVLELGFRVVYPLLARLPARVGMLGAKWWGTWMAWLDCEWRNVALRNHYVSQKTQQAFSLIATHSTSTELKDLVKSRFVCACREELEGFWLGYGRKNDLPVRIEGLKRLQEAIASGRGVVLLTFHFDAAPWGIACLGRSGLRLNLMTSNVVEDTRVPPSVRDYFSRKYVGLQRTFHGGRFLHVENHPKEFYRALERGECVVIMADAFTHRKENAVRMEFLGHDFAFASGAYRLAARTGALVAAFVCLRRHGGYEIQISPIFGLEGDPQAAVRSSLAFLEGYVRRFPASWWGADVMPLPG